MLRWIKRNWKLLVMLAVSLAALVGYRVVDGLRTDSTAPVITVDDSVMLEVSVLDRAALLTGVTAADDRDGDVTASIVVESARDITDDGCVTVTYAAFDSSGNVAKTTRTVRYTDYRSPRFTLSNSLVFTYGTNFDVLKVVGAEDVLDGDIGYRVRANSLEEVSLNTEGVHRIRFRVNNSLGEMVELVLPVEVHYTGRYNGELYLTDYLVYLEPGASFQPRDYLKEFIARGEGADLTEQLPSDLTVAVSGTVDPNTPGVYPVSYTVKRTVGNVEYVGYARLMVVVED
ncbi:MAG: DUF5011 domain-containing protein [Oscillospiraceae bacterium]|nr:DUF5011 domain-containing protein [Oscillospiraceae bacterium]